VGIHWSYGIARLGSSIVIDIALFIGGVSLIRASLKLTNQVSKADLKRGKSTRFLFNIFFAAESLKIVITIAVCNATLHSELIPLIVGIIVGVLFLPLATLGLDKNKSP
jgi:F0F1-type ATP synthase assembly protein I